MGMQRTAAFDDAGKAEVSMSSLSNNAYKWHLCNLILNMVRAAKHLPIRAGADNPYGLTAKNK